MKMTKCIIGAATLVATALTSSAAAINITVNAAGNYLQNGAGPPPVPDLSLASFMFYGSFTPLNNDPNSNFAFLQGVVTNWNNNYNPDLPTPVNTLMADVGSFNGDTYTSLSGYDYVVFHFGGGQAGDGGSSLTNDESGWWSAWYLGGNSATFTRPIEGILNKKGQYETVGGFSSARYFNGTGTPRNVPDGGSTMLTLGLGLLGLGGVRRFLFKA